MKSDPNYRTPAGVWTSPLMDVPDQGEVVAIICDVSPRGKQKTIRMKQTALYEQVDGREVWNCLQPFAMLRWWLRLPAEPVDQIIPFAGTIAEGGCNE